MGRVRDGVIIKVSKSVHADLVKAVGAYASRYGKRITYSEVIEALLSNVADPVKVIEEYINKRGGKRD